MGKETRTLARLEYPPCTGGRRSRPVADAFGGPVLPNQGPIGRPTTAGIRRAGSGSAGYLPVWSSISALGALRLTDSMPLIALALLS